MTNEVKSNLARFAADYGMLGVLALLCAFFIVVTWTQRDLRGAEAGVKVAQAFEPGERVLVIAGKGDDDAAFAKAFATAAESRQLVVVETVLGTPADARAALDRNMGPSLMRIDGVATTAAASQWTVFDGLLERFKGSKPFKVVSPGVYSGSIFLSGENLLNIVNQIVVIAVIAIGMTMMIITAGIDLSVGSLIALSSVVATMLIRDAAGGAQATATGMVLACLGAIAACAIVGLFTGTMVTAFSIPPFIVTLAMMLVASGLAFNLAQGQSISEVPPTFTWLGRGSTAGVPNAIWLLGVLYLVAHIVMTRTTLGRCIYAIGGNAEAARLSGVPVRRVLLFVYVLGSVMAGLGGVIMASQLGAGAPTYGEMYELYVIAAVVVGGTSLRGGEGKVLGTLIGAFIIAVINNGMNLTGVDPYNQKIVLGAVILAAVLLDMLKKGWRPRLS